MDHSSVHKPVFAVNGTTIWDSWREEIPLLIVPFQCTQFCKSQPIPIIQKTARHNHGISSLRDFIDILNLLGKRPLTAVEYCNPVTSENLFPPGLNFKGKRQDIKTFHPPASLRCGWASYLQQNFVKLWAP